ncbi:L-serine ammonia-lyase, iron-sulfur-dependent subunit beta [Clostridium sp. ATCC 25772]|uniref:L-serine ammonia-lyase, iron-sulfur-dependent subunit beta n=1 Tax=Clostridium sp. ATCC 25772 TaxID=1676991 RepID=UPI000785311E|nr:L-serine ammonia-lyase, iron-sulfur-dependent subunit beta [Clostridium sp. ATCC 25772]
MKNYSAFDILGPIMIGPSSSHTAGAARLAKIAAKIGGENIKKVRFLLHGSFAKTYKGHGTDKALVAGILGMDPKDERLRTSMEIAKEKGLEYTFEEVDLGEDVHPNTVKFILTTDKGNDVTVVGSSIGGGNIEIFEVEGQSLRFTGEYPTLIINHTDTPGMIYKVTTILYREEISIASMNVYRKIKGLAAAMVVEVDHIIDNKIIDSIKAIEGITSVDQIVPPKEGE